MNNSKPQLSKRRINFIRAQGYQQFSDYEIADLAFGNRFAYILCTSLLASSVAMAYIPGLLAMATIAFLTIVLPYHPFDYIYNHGLRQLLNKPQLPPRSAQLKFACTVATTWILITAYLFYAEMCIAAYVMGGLLVAVATTVSTTDYCLPSVIYNFIFNVNDKTTKVNCLLQ